MARELRRLLIDPQRLAGAHEATHRLMLEAAEDHYLTRVLRLRPGDPVAIIDGCGSLWQGRRGEGAWLEQLVRSGEPEPARSPCLTLALALPRQDVELVWRMACELGIDRLQPLRSARSQWAGRREPLQRWQAVLREATEQCERLWLPSLQAPQQALDWWSQADRAALKLLATTRRSAIAALEAQLDQSAGIIQAGGEIVLAIGPEGGWSPEEEEGAAAAGWLPVSLGATILRSGTAAVAAASRLVAWRSLSCASCRGPSPESHPDRRHCGDGGGEGPHRP